MSFLGHYVISYAVVHVPDCSPEWAIFSTASTLLRIYGVHPEYADRVITSMITFIINVIANLKESICHDFI
jgi:hypothetical protein